MRKARPATLTVPPDAAARVAELAAQGRIVQAVRIVRETTAMTLRHAKEHVESVRDRQIIDRHPGGPPTPRLLGFIADGKRIQAVKEVVETTGLSLKDAKHYVDALRRERAHLRPAPLADRVRVLRGAEDYRSAIALVRAETGMTEPEALRFIDALG
ncbi:hypothetical protein [Spirillospora sp. CA-294931]|uniref:hypothetical protein n=1 Tax=Spirillospora sp. CA-294931 TaxID=3240042 RepID=UPI003D8A33B1